MFYVPFWIMAAGFIVMALITISIRKMTLIDILVILSVIALTLASNMLSTQFSMYTVVSKQYAGWYSFWTAIIVYPSLAMTFTKFAPRSKYGLILYVGFWVIILTIFELLIVPFKIGIYEKWRTIPWSPIVYLLVFILIYAWHKYLEKRIIVK